MKYTKEKIDNCLKSLEDMKENRKKVDKLYFQLERTLRRIKLALNPTLDLKKELEDMKKIILKEQLEKQKRDPLRDYISNHLIFSLARSRIMKKYNFMPQPYEIPRWDDFIFRMKQNHKKDREKLIKEGSIKIE